MISSLSVLLKTFDIYSGDGTHLFSIPNFNLTQQRFDLNPAQRLRDYYAQFDGVTLEYSDGNDTVSGDEFFTGGVSSALSSTSSIADTLLKELSEESLIVDFGGGIDTLSINEPRVQTAVNILDETRVNVFTADNSRIQTFDLERLELTDGTFIFDEEGAYADYTYALYAASLGRTPDEEGFRFWNDVMNSGAYDRGTREATETRLARAFVVSDEFIETFNVNNVNAFITALYENVLQRAPDEAGFEFWTTTFETGDLGRSDMLRFFATSDENQTSIANDIDDGFWVA